MTKLDQPLDALNKHFLECLFCSFHIKPLVGKPLLHGAQECQRRQENETRSTTCGDFSAMPQQTGRVQEHDQTQMTNMNSDARKYNIYSTYRNSTPKKGGNRSTHLWVYFRGRLKFLCLVNELPRLQVGHDVVQLHQLGETLGFLVAEMHECIKLALSPNPQPQPRSPIFTRKKGP